MLIEAGSDENILDSNDGFGLTWFRLHAHRNRHDDITSGDEVAKMVAPDQWKNDVSRNSEFRHDHPRQHLLSYVTALVYAGSPIPT